MVPFIGKLASILKSRLIYLYSICSIDTLGVDPSVPIFASQSLVCHQI